MKNKNKKKKNKKYQSDSNYDHDIINNDEIDYINLNSDDQIDHENESIIVSEELFKQVELEKLNDKINSENIINFIENESKYNIKDIDTKTLMTNKSILSINTN